MTNITTPRLGDTAQVDRPRTEVEPGAPDATTPEAGTSRTDDDGRRRRFLPLLAIGVSVGAVALAVFAIATDDAGSEPVPPVTATTVQAPTAQPPADQPPTGGVPDGVPCPDSPIRGRQAVC